VSSCLGCSCVRPTSSGQGGRLLLATGVGHHLSALRSVLREAGASVTERAPGLLEARTPDAAALVAAARRGMSAPEAEEIRAVLVQDEQGDALLALALTAPTLAQLDARVEHADLLPLPPRSGRPSGRCTSRS